MKVFAQSHRLGYDTQEALLLRLLRSASEHFKISTTTRFEAPNSMRLPVRVRLLERLADFLVTVECFGTPCWWLFLADQMELS